MDQNNFQQFGQPGWNPNVQTSFSAPNVFVPQVRCAIIAMNL
jgi:hypothetical protein